MSRFTTLLAAISAISLGLQPSVVTSSTFRTVALTGDPAPGTSDDFVLVFDTDTATIDESGHVAFRDCCGSAGLWSEASGSLQPVALVGERAPGVPTEAYFINGQFKEPSTNRFGKIAFDTGLTGPGVDESNDEGIWSNRSGSLQLVAQAGQLAPGTVGDVRFDVFGAPLISSSGQIIFFASVIGPGVASNNDFGFWSDVNGELTLFARMGDQAPGEPSGVFYTGFRTALANVAAHTVYYAGLSDGTSGIWSDRDGTPARLVKNGDPAPGTPAGTTFRNFGNAAINTSDEIMFYADLSPIDFGHDSGIWVYGEDSSRLVVRSGDTIPGMPGATIGSIPTNSGRNQIINNVGQVAFRAIIFNSPNGSGIFLEDHGSLAIIAREGDPAPGTLPDVVFEELYASPLVLNDAAQIAFIARVEGPSVDDENNDGLWATGPDGVLRLVAREGDVFDVNDDPHIEELHTIGSFFRAIEMLSTFGLEHDGRPYVFNASGELVFGLGFTDDLYGIFVANTQVPTVTGDYDDDGDVDSADYVVWKSSFASTSNLDADGNGNGIVDAADYVVWRKNLGVSMAAIRGGLPFVPEPSAWILILLEFAVVLATSRETWSRIRG